MPLRVFFSILAGSMNTPTYEVYTDGGSRGNPGPAALGYVIYDAAGEVVQQGSQYIGVTTNNQAEYQGIAAALEALLLLKPAGPVVCKLDSQLVVRQINGVYKMKHEALRPWLNRVKEICSTIGVPVTFIDIPREQNRHADRLVNEALDGAEKTTHGS